MDCTAGHTSVTPLEDEYLIARYHVARAEEFLARQLEIIEYLDSRGLDSSRATDQLEVFETSLALMRRRVARIERQLAERSGKAEPP